MTGGYAGRLQKPGAAIICCNTIYGICNLLHL